MVIFVLACMHAVQGAIRATKATPCLDICILGPGAGCAICVLSQPYKLMVLVITSVCKND